MTNSRWFRPARSLSNNSQLPYDQPFGSPFPLASRPSHRARTQVFVVESYPVERAKRGLERLLFMQFAWYWEGQPPRSPPAGTV